MQRVVNPMPFGFESGCLVEEGTRMSAALSGIRIIDITESIDPAAISAQAA